MENELGRKISRIRKDLGRSLEDVANDAGLHRTTVGLIERGEREPTVSTLASIAKSLNVTIYDLIDENQISRSVNRDNIVHIPTLELNTGLTSTMIYDSMQYCYRLLDLIDTQLLRSGSDSLCHVVELANLSSIVGNILGAGLAKASNELYQRNRPHTYPDLIPDSLPTQLLHSVGEGIEIKVALNKNKPKGHLPKEGHYLTFRYVLQPHSEQYSSVEIWEVKYGLLHMSDFSISNTVGDSGKTAVITTSAFKSMECLFFDANLCPYKKYTR